MKSLILAGALTVLVPALACAQGMTCADYLKADKQAAAQMGGMAPSTGNAAMDAQSAAMDKKLRDYCTKNPTAGVDKAMQEALK